MFPHLVYLAVLRPNLSHIAASTLVTKRDNNHWREGQFWGG